MSDLNLLLKQHLRTRSFRSRQVQNAGRRSQVTGHRKFNKKVRYLIDHFTVSCIVAWPLNESEAGGDLVLIETSLLFC